MKMVSEAIGKTIQQVGEKFPAIKGKEIGPLPSHGSEYEFISSDFSIENGKWMAPNFHAKAIPNRGIDLKGATTKGWWIFHSYRLGCD